MRMGELYKMSRNHVGIVWRGSPGSKLCDYVTGA